MEEENERWQKGGDGRVTTALFTNLFTGSVHDVEKEFAKEK